MRIADANFDCTLFYATIYVEPSPQKFWWPLAQANISDYRKEKIIRNFAIKILRSFLAIFLLTVLVGCRQYYSAEGYYQAGYLRTNLRFAYNYKTRQLSVSASCIPTKNIDKINCRVISAVGFSLVNKIRLPQKLRNCQTQEMTFKRDTKSDCKLVLQSENILTKQTAIYEVIWKKNEAYFSVTAKNLQGNIIYFGNIFENPANDY